jgi:CubicO group peptidase (beta-lactamase class C family)
MHPIAVRTVGFLIAIVAGLLTPIVRADDPKIPATGPTDARLESFDKMMVDFLEAHPKIPGAAIAVAKDGRLVYSRGFGYADGKMKVEADSKFRIASISKPITAVAILRLVEQGKLKLDDLVFDVLDLAEPKKGFDPRWRKITIRNLLQHTGGWDRDKSFDAMFINDKICEKLGVPSPAMPKDILRYMLEQPLDFDPGSRYAYSNFGFSILGRVIEKLTGGPYEDFVRREVLEPIGAKSTRLGKTPYEDRLPGEVHYDSEGRKGKSILAANLGKQVDWPYGGWCLELMDSHGGWVSTAPDLVRFASAFNEPAKCKILTAKSIDAMFARPDGPPGLDKEGKPKPVVYGCGWNVRPASGKPPTAWHTGLFSGTSTLLVRRADGVTWAILFNSWAPGERAPSLIIDPLVHQAADAVKMWP